jgi:hypothetical protein
MNQEPRASREVVRDLFTCKLSARVPWTLDFGSCKGVHPSIAEPLRGYLEIEGSFARALDYDIWIALDPLEPARRLRLRALFQKPSVRRLVRRG